MLGLTFIYKFRLPIFIRPVSYDLELTPNLTTLEVKGIIKLIFKVRNPKSKQNTNNTFFYCKR